MRDASHFILDSTEYITIHSRIFPWFLTDDIHLHHLVLHCLYYNIRGYTADSRPLRYGVANRNAPGGSHPQLELSPHWILSSLGIWYLLSQFDCFFFFFFFLFISSTVHLLLYLVCAGGIFVTSFFSPPTDNVWSALDWSADKLRISSAISLFFPKLHVWHGNWATRGSLMVSWSILKFSFLIFTILKFWLISSLVLPLPDAPGGHRLGVNGLTVDRQNSIL